MARSPLDSVLQHLRNAILAKDAGHLTDADLAHRFAERRDEAAFAALVSRHGGLVFKVCRRVLYREADAEDAFQATFLVLARKAATVRSGTSLAGWLHRVAYHSAMKLRKSAMRRRKHEEKANSGLPIESPVATAALNELQVFLDQEIERLSDKYRVPFILCYLEGKSRAEAAQTVGLKEGTLASRLAKARETLKARLLARGVTVSAALGAVAVSESATVAAISPTLAHRTIDAALAFVAGNTSGAVSTQVLAVAEGVLRTMFAAKLKLGIPFVLVASLSVIAATGLVEQPKTKVKGMANPVAVGLPAVAEEPALLPMTDFYGDPLPPGAMARLGTVRFRSNSQLFHLAYSPDGKRLVTQSPSKITLWDADAGRKQIEFPGQCVGPLGWRDDGRGVMFVRGISGSVRFGDFTREVLKEVKLKHSPPGDVEINGYAMSPNGTYLVGGRGGTEDRARSITVWQVEPGKAQSSQKADLWLGNLLPELRPIHELGPQQGTCHQIVFSPDSSHVGIVSGPPIDRTNPRANPSTQELMFVLYDLRTGKERARRTVPMPFAYSNEEWGKMTVALSSEGQYLAVGCTDNLCHVYDLGRAVPAITFGEANKKAGYYSGWTAVAFAGDQVFAVSADDRKLHVHDAKTGRSIRPAVRAPGSVRAIAISHDGKRIATAGNESAIRQWDIGTGKEIVSAMGHFDLVLQVQIIAGGAQALTSGYDGMPRLWELRTGKELRRFELPDFGHALDAITASLTVTPDEKAFLAMIGSRVVAFDLASGEQIPVPAAMRDAVLASGAQFPVPTNLREINRRPRVFAGDGRSMLMSGNRSIGIWNWPDGGLRRNLELKKSGDDEIVLAPRQACLAPNGKLLITRMKDAVDVWDAETGAHRHRLQDSIHEDMLGIAFVDDGQQAAIIGWHPVSAKDDRTSAKRLGLWDLRSGRLVRIFDHPGTNWTYDVACDPKGYVLATADSFQGGVTLLYEVASGQIRRQFFSHFNRNCAVAFTPDGNRLVTVGEDFAGLVWDVGLMSAARGKKPASDADLERAWGILAQRNAPAAYDALLAGLMSAARGKKPSSDAEFEFIWGILAQRNAPAAYDALLALASNPEKAVAFLQKRLRPLDRLDAAAIAQILAGFESDSFTVRERALKELETLGHCALPAVRARAEKTESLEAKRRLASFLEKHDTGTLTPDELRAVRSVEFLEHAATSSAARSSTSFRPANRPRNSRFVPSLPKVASLVARNESPVRQSSPSPRYDTHFNACPRNGEPLRSVNQS